MPSRLWLLVFACASTAATAADVYKWIDAGGVVHYSDTRPAPGVKAELLHLTLTTATSEPAAAGADAATAQSAGAARKAKSTAPQLASSVMNAQKRCDQARQSLGLLQGDGPVGIDTQGNGKPQPLDARARQARIASARSVIATYCK
jgi:Domain of unknown function (DUF4124)